MTTKVQRWGNSQGLRLSRQILEDARISVGDEVDVVVQDGTIMIAPVRRVRGKYSLRQLVARVTEPCRAVGLRPVSVASFSGATLAAGKSDSPCGAAGLIAFGSHRGADFAGSFSPESSNHRPFLASCTALRTSL